MIRYLLLWFVVAVETILVFIALLLGVFFNKYGAYGKACLMYWSKGVLKTAGITLEVTGLENYNPEESYIVASNHRHFFDIPSLAIATKLNIKYVAKKELFNIPIFGQVLHLVGMISVDRGNSSKALESLKKAQMLADKYKISPTVFPEGTRSKKPGLLPFKKGPFMMSLNTGIPLLPISLEGTDKVFVGKKCIPRTVHVHIHPPVNPNDYGMEKRNDFLKDVKAIIESKPHC